MSLPFTRLADVLQSSRLQLPPLHLVISLAVCTMRTATSSVCAVLSKNALVSMGRHWWGNSTRHAGTANSSVPANQCNTLLWFPHCPELLFFFFASYPDVRSLSVRQSFKLSPVNTIIIPEFRMKAQYLIVARWELVMGLCALCNSTVNNDVPLMTF